jgi:hypothetical protein
MNYNEILSVVSALSAQELAQLSKDVVSLKKGAKENEKSSISASREEQTEAVNALIEQGRLVKGSVIVISYKGKPVEATVKTVPTVKAKNLNLESESFDTKDKSRYAEKYNFIRFA